MTTTVRDYILGIRLGTGSLGWAALTVDSNDHPVSILALGARKFPVGATGDVESGREEPPNQRRRLARGIRVRLDRRVTRLRTLWRLLQGAGLLPPGRFADRDRILKAFDGANDRHPYRLRARGLDGPLSAHELGRALYHLAQRRGFQSNRRADAKTPDDVGVVKRSIAELEQTMAQAGARTLGEYLHKQPERTVLRRRWTSRDMVRREFDLLVGAQTAHHSCLTPGFVLNVSSVIFAQRKLQSQTSRIGRCDLEPARRRCQLASYDAQEFRMLCRVNDLRLVDDVGGATVDLTPEQRTTLLTLLQHGDHTYPKVRKALGLARTVRFNVERIDDEKLLGMRTCAKLRTACGPAWDALSMSDQRALVDDLLNIDDDAGLTRRLTNRWKFDGETVDRLLRAPLEPGYSSLSHKAIARMLPALRQGRAYATVRKELYPQADHHIEVARLPLIQDAYRYLANPLVRRSLGELRVVVNHIVARYGRPQAIRVALMRGLRLGRKARERAQIKMRAVNKSRAKAAAQILADFGVMDAPRWMIDKYLLAEECGWTCPYTGKTISMRSVLGGEQQFEVIYIVPFEQSLDDTFENKALCHVSAMPRPAVDTKTFERFDRMTGPFADEKRRRVRLTREQIDAEYAEALLADRFADSCYSSKLAVDLLARLYPPTSTAVTAVRGPVAGYVREACGLNRIELPPGSYRHGALEACSLALCGPGIVRRLTTAAVGVLGRRRLNPGPVLPWPTFTENVREALSTLIVSARIRKKASGPLHEETIYRHLHDEPNGRALYCVRKALWSLGPGDVEAIIGDRIREAVKVQLTALKEPSPAKAFANGQNLPAYRGSFIRRVQVRRTDELFRIDRGFVGTERNHHAVVFLRSGRGGREIADREVVSQFEAQRRLARRQPIVQTAGRQLCENFPTLAVLETLHVPDLGYHTVRCVSKDPSIVLVGIDDGRTLAEVIADKKRIRMSVEQLRLRGATKVTITPLGEVRRDGS